MNQTRHVPYLGPARPHGAVQPPRRWSPRAAARLGLALLALVFVLLVLLIWFTNYGAWRYRIGFTSLYLVRGGLLALSVVVAIAALVVGVVGRRRSRLVMRVCASSLAIFLTLVLLECVFMFVPRSHNVGYTLGSQVWRRYYWRGINSLGYRDLEHRAVPGKKLVFFVGDSFTAGAGQPHVETRFSDLVEARHPEWHALNLGVSGIDTIEEYDRLVRHPLEPDAVVLQYYPNDIEGAAARAGWPAPSWTPYVELPWGIRHVVRGSFLFNYIYWCFPHDDSAAYSRMLDEALADDALMEQHLADLARFCDYTEERDIPLVVVMVPCLIDPERDHASLERIAAMFEARGAHVIDVKSLVENLPVVDRIANRHDVHPSVRVHELVADAIGAAL